MQEIEESSRVYRLALLHLMVSCSGSQEEGRRWSQTDRVPVGANRFHSLTSAAGVHLFQDVVDVISNRELRKIQLRGDFFIGETFRYKNYQLLLTDSKIRFWARALDWHLFDYVSNEAE